MGKDRNLEFDTYEHASEWFENSDLADYLDQLLPVEFSFDLRKTPDLIVLDREIAKSLRSMARKAHIPTRKLVNRLLRKCIEEDRRSQS